MKRNIHNIKNKIHKTKNKKKLDDDTAAVNSQNIKKIIKRPRGFGYLDLKK
jgi:hypothetical protein